MVIGRRERLLGEPALVHDQCHGLETLGNLPNTILGIPPNGKK